MNTQVGKSVGIALLLAAGLLAVLFAFGVFAPAGVDAGVKTGGGSDPTAKLTPSGVGKASVLTFTFQLTEEIDGTILSGSVDGDVSSFNNANADANIGDDSVVINFTAPPFVFAGVTADNISVRQNGTEVGKVYLDTADLTIFIDRDTGNNPNPNVKGGVETVVRITGLTNNTTATAGSAIIHQGAPTAALPIVVSPSVTYSDVTLNNDGAGEVVDMTLKFRADTASTADQTANQVVIVLPVEDFDLDGDTAGRQSGEDNIAETFEVMRGTTPITLLHDVTNGTEANAIAVTGFAANELVTITVKGVAVEDDPDTDDTEESLPAPKNPATSKAVTFTFAQALQTPVKETRYVTDKTAIAVNPMDEAESILSSVMAGEDGVSMEFQFSSVVNVNENTEIVITLDDRYVFEGDTEEDIVVWQLVKTDEDGDPVLDDDDNEIPIQVDYDVDMDDDGQNIVITLNDDSDGSDPDDDQNMETDPAGMGTVMVKIGKLVNPNVVGSVDVVTVEQGGYASVSREEVFLGTEISTTVAGANVRVRITTRAGATIPPGDDIVVKLKDFVVPASIPVNQIIIDGAEDDEPGQSPGDAYDGNPAAVSISKTTVNLGHSDCPNRQWG